MAPSLGGLTNWGGVGWGIDFSPFLSSFPTPNLPIPFSNPKSSNGSSRATISSTFHFWRGRLSIAPWFGRVEWEGFGSCFLHSIHQLSVLLKSSGGSLPAFPSAGDGTQVRVFRSRSPCLNPIAFIIPSTTAIVRSDLIPFSSLERRLSRCRSPLP